MKESKHWSKQFWPWFLILLPSAGVVAGIVTVCIAIGNAPTITNDHIGRFGKTEQIDSSR